jgi:hypothetical protein
MALGEDGAGRVSPFERMLDELDEASERDVGSGAERLWPRASPLPRAEVFVPGEAVESLYVESGGSEAPTQEPASSPREPFPKTRMADLAAEFAELPENLAAARSPDDLRQMRRRFALILHPDRVPPLDRALAEKWMAEVNAAIDCAIRSRFPSGKRRAGARR